MNVAVIGTGYVGSVTGACLAMEGNMVTCVDIDPAKVDSINDGKSPISEPRLGDIIADTVNKGYLRATTDLGSAVARADVIMLSLPTPKGNDGADLSYLYNVADRLGQHIQEGAIVANRSTVPIGTTHHVRDRIAATTGKPFFAVSNPEFLAEGTAVRDTTHPSRVVIGADSDEPARVMTELFRPFVLDNPGKILVYDVLSAEATKLAANTLLAAHVAVVNVIAEACERVGADWRQVQRGVGLDGRVGKFLHPSPGFGGACFPKDVRALAAMARELGVDASLLELINVSNEHQKRRWVEKVKSHFNADLDGRKIAIWGLAFKPNTDDIRESAALTMIEELTNAGAALTVYDPQAMDNVRKYFGGNELIRYADNREAALDGAEALVIMTEWDVFRAIDLEAVKSTMAAPVIFDARSIYSLKQMRHHGFYYDSVGRPVVDGR